MGLVVVLGSTVWFPRHTTYLCDDFNWILGIRLFSKLYTFVDLKTISFGEGLQHTTFLFGNCFLSTGLYCPSDAMWCTIFDYKDNFVGSFYYSTCKFDWANDEFDRTRRFETLHNCCHQERFQMFITTPIGATSTNFVIKRDLKIFCSTCGSLRKSFWRHDMNPTLIHSNWSGQINGPS